MSTTVLHCTRAPASVPHRLRKPTDHAGRVIRVDCVGKDLDCTTSSRTPLAVDPGQGIHEDLDSFERFILDLQGQIVTEAEELNGDEHKFCVDRWTRGSKGSFGATCVLEGGSLLEKAAVNTTIVSGDLTPERAAAMSSRGRALDPKGEILRCRGGLVFQCDIVNVGVEISCLVGNGDEGGQGYSAAALSLVFHSAHPFVPTLRADIRRFKVEGMSWYGGGADLTPFYVVENDFKNFHCFWKGQSGVCLHCACIAQALRPPAPKKPCTLLDKLTSWHTFFHQVCVTSILRTFTPSSRLGVMSTSTFLLVVSIGVWGVYSSMI